MVTSDADKPPAEPGPLDNPKIAAPLLLIVLWLWPAWELYQVLTVGGSFAFPIAMAVLFPIAPVGVWFRRKWAWTATQYIAAIAAGWMLVQAVFQHQRAAFVPGAVFAGLFFWIGSRPDPDAPPSTGDKKDDGVAWARENAEAIAVAFIMALIIRCFCIEVFQIPSSSMEPTLMGGSSDKHSIPGCDFKNSHFGEGGDRIMVTKYYYAFNPIERFDVVVFKFPLNQARNFIKRVVGMPGEQIFIESGNIWFLKSGTPDPKGFQIARRPLRIQQSMWIDVLGVDPDPPGRDLSVLRNNDTFETKFGIEGEEPYKFEVSNHELRTLPKGKARSIKFVRRSRLDTWEGRIAFDVELAETKGTFRTSIVNDFGKFQLTLGTTEQGDLSWKGPQKQPKQDLIKHAPLTPRRKYRVELLVYDGLCQALIDGRVVGEIEFLRYHSDIDETQGEREISFEATDVLFTVSRLEVGRDIAYAGRTNILEGIDHPYDIPAGCYVMMGDNVGSSHDSRAWRRYTFTFNDGRKPVVCESQDFKSSDAEIQEWCARTGYKSETSPDYVLIGDEFGMEHAIDKRTLVLTEKGEYYKDDPFPLVEEKFIVGKALWIWWPPGRWGRLIK